MAFDAALRDSLVRRILGLHAAKSAGRSMLWSMDLWIERLQLVVYHGGAEVGADDPHAAPASASSRKTTAMIPIGGGPIAWPRWVAPYRRHEISAR